MQELIYYPGFEVQNLDWLKFSLLYLDKLDPIIPNTGDKYLSPSCRKLMDETDLISVHRPDNNEGHLATLDAIEHIEKVLRNPSRYEQVFGRRDIDQAWKDPKNWKATLFEEKYSHEWEYFCIQSKLGQRNRVGFSLHHDIMLLYMTILSQAIADSRRISPITDHPLLDKFSIFTRKTDSADKNAIEAAQCILNLKLPANLSDVSLEDVISHRNKPGFREKQKAFHLELNNYLSGVEGGNPEQFSNSLGSLWSDFSDDILQIGTGAAAFGIGIWILLQAPIAVGEAVKEIAGGASLVVGASVAIKGTWNNTRSKRFTRRFLSDLSSLKPAEL
jgi:hypothetical protein